MPTGNLSNVNATPVLSNYGANPMVPLNPTQLAGAPSPYMGNQGLQPQAPLENAQPALNSFAPSGWNDPPVYNKGSKVQVSCFIKKLNVFSLIFVLIV